jgi:hypothetical protein
VKENYTKEELKEILISYNNKSISLGKTLLYINNFIDYNSESDFIKALHYIRENPNIYNVSCSLIEDIRDNYGYIDNLIEFIDDVCLSKNSGEIQKTINNKIFQIKREMTKFYEFFILSTIYHYKITSKQPHLDVVKKAYDLTFRKSKIENFLESN